MERDLTRRELFRRATLLAAMHAPLLRGAAFAGETHNPEFHLKRIRLTANNLDALEVFYRDVLNVPVQRADGGALLQITFGASRIEFVPEEKVSNPFYHFAFTIPENKLEAAMTWLAPRCEILNIRNTHEKVMHFKTWNAHSCYFFDPAGNILEFIAHHDLRNSTTSPFGPDQLLRVSEIGIVVPDVPALQTQAAEALGILPYRESFPNFSPIGSIHGVLIVVQKDRVWLPTNDVHAGVFPTLVEARGPQGKLIADGLPYSVVSAA